MRKIWLACSLAAITLVSCHPPLHADRPKGQANLYSAGEGAQFRCQLSQRLGAEPDSLHLVVATSIPYDNLIFLRSDTGFVAAFELVTSLFRDSAGLYSERIVDSFAKVPTFAETNSRSRNVARLEEFLVPAGRYRVRVTLTTDREAHRKSRWEGSISMPPSDPRLRVSDIYWAAEDRSLKELGVPKLVDNFSSTDSTAKAQAQIYSSGRDSIHVQWSLVNAQSDTIRKSEEVVQPSGKVQDIDYVIQIIGLVPQRYTLSLVADAGVGHESRERSFGVRISGIPVQITDLDLAIRELKYVASSAQMAKLRAATPADKEKAFKDFWQEQGHAANGDPNELMDEYYRRVQYSNEHFATNRPGWESDRGRIYVTYGEPTDIERHPFEAGSYPYEIWYYNNLARRFIFVDSRGFGDYTLAGPEWGY